MEREYYYYYVLLVEGVVSVGEYGEFMGDDTLENGCCPHVYSALPTIQCATPKHFSPLKLKHGECRDPWSEQKRFEHKGIDVVFFFSHQQYHAF